MDFPVGVQDIDDINMDADGSPAETDSLWSVSTWILPFMEQNNAFDVLGARSSNTLSSQLRNNPQSSGSSPTLIILETFPAGLCPSDSGGDINSVRTGLGLNDMGTAKTNYVYANNALRNPFEAANDNEDGWINPGGPNNNTNPTGIFSDREQGLGSMRDGSTNVIILSERNTSGTGTNANGEQIQANPGAGLLYGVRGDVFASSQSGRDVDTDAGGFQDIAFASRGRINSQDPVEAPHGVSSNHNGGVNVVLGDASTHFMNDSTNQVTLNQLINIRDGNVVDDHIAN